ncbi:hypothetical protein DVK02_19145, partial [Halobellus sp. Atlit-31R]
MRVLAQPTEEIDDLSEKTMMSALMAALMALASPTALGGQAAPAMSSTSQPGAVADGARLLLRWELQRQPAGLQLPQGGSPARFVLTNGDTRPLPPSGWTLYFTSIDRMPSGAQSAGLVLEQIAGGLNRLRPGP